jgi:hypothetical protein
LRRFLVQQKFLLNSPVSRELCAARDDNAKELDADPLGIGPLNY